MSEQVYLNSELIQKNIILKAISLFDSNSILNGANSNLFQAFNVNVLNAVSGTTVKITLQDLTGANNPSIRVDNQTDFATLTPVHSILNLVVAELRYYIEFDVMHLEGKLIDAEAMITRALKKLEMVMWSLILRGYYDKVSYLGNNVINIGAKTPSKVNFDKSVTANEVLGVFAEAKSRVARATGRNPNVLIIDPSTLDKIGLKDTKIANFMVNEYLTKQLGFKIFTTPLLNKVKDKDGKDLGSCFIVTTDDADDLQVVVGKLPYVGKQYETRETLEVGVGCGIAGAYSLNPNPEAVQVYTNLTEDNN